MRYEADVRYLRQGYEFSLDVTPDPLANGGMRGLHERFGARHEQLYGFRLDHPVELVNLRAVGAASVIEGRASPASRGKAIRPPGRATDETARVLRPRLRGRRWSTIAAGFSAGHMVPGPAIITQPDTTTVIHPGHVGEVDEYLNVLIGPVRDSRASPGHVEGIELLLWAKSHEGMENGHP